MGGGYGMMWNKWGAKPVVNQYTQTNQNQNGEDWKLISNAGFEVMYNSNWLVQPMFYGSPAMMAEGKQEHVGYEFTIKKDVIISWGGPQSGCNGNEYGVFQYGVSSVACVKNFRSQIGQVDVRSKLSQIDLNTFGDFVLKNK